MASQDISSARAYPNLVALGASVVVVYIFTTAIYRLFFHPLASFPGPFWARLTIIPSWWHTRPGDRHVWLYNLQQKYGELAYEIIDQPVS